MQALCRQLAAGTAGKAVLDATNPLMAASSGGGGVETRCLAGGGRGHDASAGAELIQRHLPQAHVFKAFNTLGFEFFDVAETGCGGRPLTMLFAGGDSGSPGHRKAAELVIRAVGFEPVYAGGIRQARNLEALAELYINMAASVRGGARDFHFQVEAIRPTMTKPEATMAEPPLGA